jgi:hypothetical protein
MEDENRFLELLIEANLAEPYPEQSDSAPRVRVARPPYRARRRGGTNHPLHIMHRHPTMDGGSLIDRSCEVNAAIDASDAMEATQIGVCPLMMDALS